MQDFQNEYCKPSGTLTKLELSRDSVIMQGSHIFKWGRGARGFSSTCNSSKLSTLHSIVMTYSAHVIKSRSTLNVDY